MQSARRFPQRQAWLLLWLLLAAGLLLVPRVRTVTCHSQQGVIEDGVCQELQAQLAGRLLLWTNFARQSIFDELLVHPVYSQSYQLLSVSKRLQGTLHLELLIRDPDYRLRVAEDSYLLNLNPTLRQDDPELHILSIDFLADPAELLSKGQLQEVYHAHFMSLSQALRRYKIPSTQVLWHSDQEICVQTADLCLLLDTELDFDYQLWRAAQVLNDRDLEDDLRRHHTLDLRFRQPVLK